MCKRILRSLLFLLILLLLIQIISPVFLPKDNTKAAGIHSEEAKGYLSLPENTLDILFLGDSECYSSFIPLHIWEDHGITSYICGGGNQIMPESYSYLKNVFQYHQPRVVILEANAIYREFTVAEFFSHEMQQLLPFLEYHDRWKDLRSEDFTQSPIYTNIVRDKGYSFRYTVQPRHTQFLMEPTDEMIPVPVINHQYVRLIRDFCAEQGSQLLLVSAPNAKNWSMYHHNGTAQLAAELNISFLDLNLLQQEIPIDLTTDTHDGGEHLNYFGAIKSTAYLSKYLWNTGLFENKREFPEYAGWNADLEAFHAELTSAGINNTP